MHVYKAVVEKFLPTPSKSHYVFNLRDFARVVFGVLLVPSTHLQDGDKLIRLWIHEVYRVFYDRLIDNSDRVMFFEMMKETTKHQFKKDMDSLLDHVVPTGQKLKDDHIRLSLVLRVKCLSWKRGLIYYYLGHKSSFFFPLKLMRLNAAALHRRNLTAYLKSYKIKKEKKTRKANKCNIGMTEPPEQSAKKTGSSLV